MSTFAPLQFLKSAQNPLVWTAVDNGTDTRTSLIIYYGAANTLPADTDMYEVNCIMMHQAEKQLYSNTGTIETPVWEAFGPNSALPNPLVPGSFLFTDGATVYWATQLVGQVQYNASNLNQYGILNFNNLLVASNDVPNSRINVDLDVVSLAGDATFISNLEGNLDLANIGGAIDLSTQVTGVLNSTNIDITALEGDLDLTNIAGQIDLTTQVTGQLPASNIDVADLITQLNNNVTVAVDGVTITGDGTTANPLVAVGGSLEVEENGVSVETGVTKINILSNSPIVTNPATGEVDIDLTNISSGSGGGNLLYDAWDDFLSFQTDDSFVSSKTQDNGIYPVATGQTNIGLLNWSGGTQSLGNKPFLRFIGSDTDHPGIVRLGDGYISVLQLGYNNTSMKFAVDDIMRDGNIYHAVISPFNDSTGTQDLIFAVGGEIATHGAPNSSGTQNSIRLIFDASAGDMIFATADAAGTAQTTNIGAYTLTDWYEIDFKINGGSVECYIGVNGATPVLVATHSTNVPTSVQANPYFIVGIGAQLDIDFFGMKYGRELSGGGESSSFFTDAKAVVSEPNVVNYPLINRKIYPVSNNWVLMRCHEFNSPTQTDSLQIFEVNTSTDTLTPLDSPLSIAGSNSLNSDSILVIESEWIIRTYTHGGSLDAYIELYHIDQSTGEITYEGNLEYLPGAGDTHQSSSSFIKKVGNMIYVITSTFTHNSPNGAFYLATFSINTTSGVITLVDSDAITTTPSATHLVSALQKRNNEKYLIVYEKDSGELCSRVIEIDSSYNFVGMNSEVALANDYSSNSLILTNRTSEPEKFVLYYKTSTGIVLRSILLDLNDDLNIDQVPVAIMASNGSFDGAVQIFNEKNIILSYIDSLNVKIMEIRKFTPNGYISREPVFSQYCVGNDPAFAIISGYYIISAGVSGANPTTQLLEIKSS